MRRAPALVLGLLACALACQSKPRGHPMRSAEGPQKHTRRDLELSAEQEAYLAKLAAEADQNPEDFEALERSGLAHMNFTLAGVLHLRDRAEQDLEAAFALDPSDELLTRSLGRFYNLRAVAGDYSKADMQVKVYAALLGDEDPMAMTDSKFVAYSFFMLGQILADKNRGRNFQALSKVGELEEQLAERIRRQPDNIEFHALAGNFAFFFAGNIPLSRERRVREAVAYFEVLRARWSELRPGARDPMHCPNTRENFMFELAEGYMVLEQPEQARPIYEELAQIHEPRTRGKELIAHVSQERLRNLDRYVGEMRLMPPWPSDVSNCVVCHAWSSEVGLASLYSVEDIHLEDVPSKAQLKPIVGLLNMPGADGPGETVEIADRERLPAELAELIEGQCAPCHFEGGQVVDMLDLSRAAEIEAHAEVIAERVEAGEMPPEGGLDEGQRAIVRDWAAGLEPARDAAHGDTSE
jgi:tetratricopeptide (TPR) repeat protein